MQKIFSWLTELGRKLNAKPIDGDATYALYAQSLANLVGEGIHLAGAGKYTLEDVNRALGILADRERAESKPFYPSLHEIKTVMFDLWTQRRARERYEQENKCSLGCLGKVVLLTPDGYNPNHFTPDEHKGLKTQAYPCPVCVPEKAHTVPGNMQTWRFTEMDWELLLPKLIARLTPEQLEKRPWLKPIPPHVGRHMMPQHILRPESSGVPDDDPRRKPEYMNNPTRFKKPDAPLPF